MHRAEWPMGGSSRVGCCRQRTSWMSYYDTFDSTKAAPERTKLHHTWPTLEAPANVWQRGCLQIGDGRGGSRFCCCEVA